MTKNIVYINILRLIACFLVIVNHTHGFMLNYANSFLETAFYCLGFSFCKIGVLLFLMITGILLLDKEYGYKKVLKCIIRVLIPLIVVSFALYLKDVGVKNINIFNFLRDFINTPYVLPFWYLYLLMGLYLVIPFIQKMLKNFKNIDYLYFIIVFLLVPSLLSLFSIYFNFKYSFYFTLAFFPMAIGVLIAGNYISKLKLKKTYAYVSALVFILSYIGMFLSMYLPFLQNKTISYTLDTWTSFPVLLMALSFIYIIRYLFENKKWSNKTVRVITNIASTTFGIYLIHLIFNHRLYESIIFEKILSFNSCLGIIILEISVFAICSIIIFILKKLPIIRKFL